MSGEKKSSENQPKIEPMNVEEEAPKNEGCCKLEVCQPAYPKCVFFIIGEEFCERFCYYGMRSVLQTYLMLKLGVAATTASSLYHAFIIIAYFTPSIGAIIADSFLGRYWTIFTFSLIYITGNVIMATTAIGDGVLVGTLIGMFTIATGTGGIKANVSPFGASQFKLPQQAEMQKSFFSMYYVAINAGSLLSQFITPLIKAQSCFGEKECWILAFGFPAALMLCASTIFLSGTPFYERNMPKQRVAVNLISAVCKGIWRNCCCRRKKKVDHWLDRTVPDFTQEFVDDCKCVLRVLFLFLPLPFFWALFDQQGSRWLYMGQKMNSYIDFLDVHVEAEQMNILNGFLVVILVPIFDTVIYPLLAKCNLLKRPLQRLVTGCVFAATSFVIIGFLQLSVQNVNDVVVFGNDATYRTRVFNINPSCEFDLYRADKFEITLKPRETFLFGPNRATNGTILEFKNICGDKFNNQKFTIITKSDKPLSSIFFDEMQLLRMTHSIDAFPLNAKGERQNEHLFQILISSYTPLLNDTIKWMAVYKGNSEMGGVFYPDKYDSVHSLSYTTSRVPSQYYRLRYVRASDNKTVEVNKDMYLLQGGDYTVYLTRNAMGEDIVELLIDKKNNGMPIFYMVFGYLILTSGEILYSVTGLSFAFTQAPMSMKSILVAGWQLTTCFGDVIDLIIINIQIPDKAIEFFVFAGLMYFVTVIVAIMTYLYKPIQRKEETPPPPLAETVPDSAGQKDAENQPPTTNKDEEPEWF